MLGLNDTLGMGAQSCGLCLNAVALLVLLASESNISAIEPAPAGPDAHITMPVDLSPQIKPEYTAAARAEGKEGTLTLEVVVSSQGKVLRVKSIGKKLGFGLDEAAIKAFKSKKFKPAHDANGKAVAVKYYERIEFTFK